MFVCMCVFRIRNKSWPSKRMESECFPFEINRHLAMTPPYCVWNARQWIRLVCVLLHSLTLAPAYRLHPIPDWHDKYASGIRLFANTPLIYRHSTENSISAVKWGPSASLWEKKLPYLTVNISTIGKCPEVGIFDLLLEKI